MRKSHREILPAYTLVEMFIVMVILAIIAAIAVPLYTSAASTEVKAAANMIASDLEYAESMAMSTGRNYSAVFDASAESYSIKDCNNQVISHPVHVGTRFIVNFANDSRLNKVDIVSAFGSTTTSVVTFDYLGAPSNSGSILLRSDGITMTVKVAPVTGYVSIE
jgi:Tfp pilus assembly protein FimT